MPFAKANGGSAWESNPPTPWIPRGADGFDRAQAYATDFYDADKVFLLIGLNAPLFHREFSVVVEHNELDAARDFFRDISFVAEECKRHRCKKEDFTREVAARFSKACASGRKHSFCTDDDSKRGFSFNYWMTFGTAFGLEGAPKCRPRTFGSFATSIGPRIEHGMCVDDGVVVQHQAEVPASEYDAEDCARTVGRLTREWRHAGGEGPGFVNHEAEEDMLDHWSVIFEEPWERLRP